MLTYSMRSIITMGIAMVCSLSPNWVNATPVVLDFEGLTAMNFFSGSPIPIAAQLSDQFVSSYGVEFGSGSPYVAVVELGAGHATSGVNGIGGYKPDGLLTYDNTFPIVATFFNPNNPSQFAVTDYVSVRGDHAGSGELITLNAYDIANNLIASFTTPDSGGVTMSVATPGIHSVQFLGTHDNDGVALDDFTFNSVTFKSVATVSEPSTFMLLSLGTVGLVGLSWRGSKA